MTRVGRKPLSTGHVDKLYGSPRAKQWMTAILKTLSGEWTIPDACLLLGVHEAHFHAMRGRWLREALHLLEPRPAGRPRKAGGQMEDPRDERIEELRRQLALSDARREVAEVLGATAELKKGRVVS